jgi:Na+-driven multidrug efflux pump
MNALAGTGATWFGLKLQALVVSVYLGYLYVITNFSQLGLLWVWAAEIIYWVVMLAMVVFYLRTERWHKIEF